MTDPAPATTDDGLREAVERLAAKWEADDEESLNRVGQHLMGGAVLSCAEHVRALLAAHPATPPAEDAVDLVQRHRDALADTGDAYHAFHGWVLNCLWCEFEAVGKSKAEALRGIQRHYDAVLPEGCEIR